MSKVIAIAAVAANGVIGNKGTLPWTFPEDSKRFMNVTKGNIVLMGRKTFESINKEPLPDRLNVVVSRSAKTTTISSKGVMFEGDLEKAVERYSKSRRTLYIVGGSQIYKDTMHLVDELDITQIDLPFQGDTYFPKIDPYQFELMSRNFLQMHCWVERYASTRQHYHKVK